MICYAEPGEALHRELIDAGDVCRWRLGYVVPSRRSSHSSLAVSTPGKKNCKPWAGVRGPAHFGHL
jgi:hypothetical protein